jgi:hypothetical protein
VGITARLADVEGAFDVGVHIIVRCHIGIRDGNQGRQVKDHIDLLGELFAGMRVPDIAAHHLQVVPVLDDLQPPPVVKGVVQTQGPDLAAHVQQGFSEVGADEAVRAGDQYSFVSEFHFGVTH